MSLSISCEHTIYERKFRVAIFHKLANGSCVHACTLETVLVFINHIACGATTTAADAHTHTDGTRATRTLCSDKAIMEVVSQALRGI